MRKILLMTMLFLTVLTAGAPAPEANCKARIEQWLYIAPLDEDNLKLALELNELVSPEIVIRQSRLETGNFKSELCVEHNNLFGMRLARIRPTTALGATENNYAYYEVWYDSVRDMKLFQNWYQDKGRDLSDYYGFLKVIGYAEDPEYLNKLQCL